MNLRRILAMSALTLLVLFTACAKDSTGPDDDAPPVSWTLGEQETYTITGSDPQTVFDYVTGLEFRFPEGGEGELTVAEITAGPEAPYEGTGFSVDFTGVAPIELVVDRYEEDEQIMVMAYGTMRACWDDELAGNDRWLTVPETDSANGQSVFELDVTTDDPGSTLAKTAVRTFKYHWISRLTSTSTRSDSMQAIRFQSQDFVTQFINELPDTLKTRIDGEIKGRLKVRYAWDGVFYSGFWRRTLGPSGWAIVPTLHFRAGSDQHSVAHETGHYLVHALVGDNVQSTLEGQGNLYDDHDPGDDLQRAKLLEDYAYFLEYYFTNAVGGYNPEHPYLLWKGLNFLPITQDLPGREGFGLFMLAGLTRTGTSMQSLVNARVSLPVPELGKTFSEGFQIIRRGATNIAGLLTNIQATLTAEENKKYQVIMQRYGWQYKIGGTLVDKDGKGVEDVLVSNMLTAGGIPYEGGLTYVPTDKDGKFNLTGEVFPGKSTLRCVKGTDTAFVDIEIDWAQQTNVKVNVGPLAVDFDNLLAQLQSKTRISIDVIGEHHSNYGEMYAGTTFRPTMDEMTWNGTSFSALETSSGARFTSEYRVNGTVSSNGRKIVSLTYTRTFRSTSAPGTPNGILRDDVDTEITITDLDFTDISFGSPRFLLSGPEAAGHTSLKYKRVVEYEDPEFGTVTTQYSHTNWSSTTTTPSIVVYFSN